MKAVALWLLVRLLPTSMEQKLEVKIVFCSLTLKKAFLGGGFNPFEASKIEFFLNMGEDKKLKPPPSFSVLSSPLPLPYFSNNQAKAQTIRSASS